MQFGPFTVKFATENWEFEQIYRLNYKAFVEEIPQHPSNPDRLLVDKFHQENLYLICLLEKQLVGMVAFRDKRPFSLDQKLRDLDTYLPPFSSICEIRLLTIEEAYRDSPAFWLMLREFDKYWQEKGYDLLVASGTTRQLRLYNYLGFVPFGPLVGSGDARFQPMHWTRESFMNSPAFKRLGDKLREHVYVHLLPGPVSISHEVRQAFSENPVYHRSTEFVEKYEEAKILLRQMADTRYVQIMMGSGTLANDAIAAQLSLLNEHGLIISNGEFGERLIDHSNRHRLSFDTIKLNWGDMCTQEQIAHALGTNAHYRWLWTVHCETSTGWLFDLAILKNLCSEFDVKLCLDCISTIGVIPLDLQTVYLASGTSGKGLGAYPGLSFVFHNHDILPAPEAIPRYLDLGLFASSSEPPFTFSSNLVLSLHKALQQYQWQEHFQQIRELSRWVRKNLEELGLRILVPDEYASPAVITTVLPEDIDSCSLGEHLEEAGYLLGYRSSYLVRRNWVQIALMGKCTKETVQPLFREMRKYIAS